MQQIVKLPKAAALALLTALAFGGHSTPATAAGYLPPYCSNKLSEAERYRWGKIFGPAIAYVPNYCTALALIDNAKRQFSGNPERIRNLVNARTNLAYVLEHTDEKFALAADLQIRMGEVLSLGGDAEGAGEHYRKATEVNPEYPQGWAAYGKFFAARGDPEKAREVLEQGIQQVPDQYAKYLQRRLDELDSP